MASPDLLLSFHATNPDFWCGPSSDSTPMRLHLTTISAGTIHRQIHGQVYTMVFRFSTMDEMLAAIDTINMGNYCSLLTSQWVVAEGIANWSNTDNNLINSTGNKPDSWGVRVTGRLRDLTGSCPAGGTAFSVHYEMICPKLNHQEQCWPNCCNENWHPPWRIGVIILITVSVFVSFPTTKLAESFSWTTIDVPFPEATGTMALGMNPSGEIVGLYWDSYGVSHGYLLSKGVFTNIDVPGAKGTSANGINPAGNIVGGYLDGGNMWHGFLLKMEKQ